MDANNFKLGFGLMRLPRKGAIIDVEKVKAMVDAFIQAGGTYFDTAYVYLGSEAATKKALVDRYPRESYTLASKLNVNIAPSEKFAKSELSRSLQKTGAGYFDYYLLHAIVDNNYKKYDNYGLWDFVREQKEKGLIKHYGFSFHSGPELLDKLLTEHPDVEFVQLQLNYADWENPSVNSRANYEVALKHNKAIVIMEPVKGGQLASPPAEVKALFEVVHPTMSCASWAIRYAASLQNVLAVLSGMSNIEQMKDNISYMTDFKPLSEEERAAIFKAQRILKRSATVPCTACRYCVEGCPKRIPIPSVFAAVNKQLGSGLIEEAKADYAALRSKGATASDCIACRKCERVCPQHINISEQMKNATRMFPDSTLDS